MNSDIDEQLAFKGKKQQHLLQLHTQVKNAAG